MRKFVEGFAKEFRIDLTDMNEVNMIDESDVIEYYVNQKLSEVDKYENGVYRVEQDGSGMTGDYTTLQDALVSFIHKVINNKQSGYNSITLDYVALDEDDNDVFDNNDELVYQFVTEFRNEDYDFIDEVMQFLYKLNDQLEDEDFQEEYKTMSLFAKFLADNQVSAYKVSQETGVPQTTLSRYVREEANIADATVLNIYKISKYFKMSVEDFLKEMKAI